jgi:hypothetical protein
MKDMSRKLYKEKSHEKNNVGLEVFHEIRDTERSIYEADIQMSQSQMTNGRLLASISKKKS